jgi:hypothetical protein
MACRYASAGVPPLIVDARDDVELLVADSIDDFPESDWENME